MSGSITQCTFISLFFTLSYWLKLLLRLKLIGSYLPLNKVMASTTSSLYSFLLFMVFFLLTSRDPEALWLLIKSFNHWSSWILITELKDLNDEISENIHTTHLVLSFVAFEITTSCCCHCLLLLNAFWDTIASGCSRWYCDTSLFIQ